MGDTRCDDYDQLGVEGHWRVRGATVRAYPCSTDRRTTNAARHAVPSTPHRITSHPDRGSEPTLDPRRGDLTTKVLAALDTLTLNFAEPGMWPLPIWSSQVIKVAGKSRPNARHISTADLSLTAAPAQHLPCSVAQVPKGLDRHPALASVFADEKPPRSRRPVDG